MGLFSSRKPKVERFQSPEQKEIMDQILAAVRGESTSGPFAELFGPEDTSQLREQFQTGFVDPQRREFEQTRAPQIREQFLTAGAGQSSAANEEIQRQGFDLETSLDEALARLLLGSGQERQGQQRDILTKILEGSGSQSVLVPGAPSTLQTLVQGLTNKFDPFSASAGLFSQNSPFGQIGQQQGRSSPADFSGLGPIPNRVTLPQFSTRLQ